MTPTTPTTFAELVNLLLELVNILIVVLLSFVFLYFVWKTIDSWIIHVGDPQRREAGKQYAVAAVVAFVVLLSAWGIVALLQRAFFGAP
ncbi:MAG: hypothetical protein ACOC4E_01690 [Patescibacteria group bacterium]